METSSSIHIIEREASFEKSLKSANYIKRTRSEKNSEFFIRGASSNSSLGDSEEKKKTFEE